MAVRRNGVRILRVKIGDCHRDDRLADFDRHQLSVIHIADVVLQTLRHQWDEIAVGVVAIVRVRESKRVDVFAGEKFGLHGSN